MFWSRLGQIVFLMSKVAGGPANDAATSKTKAEASGPKGQDAEAGKPSLPSAPLSEEAVSEFMIQVANIVKWDISLNHFACFFFFQLTLVAHSKNWLLVTSLMMQACWFKRHCWIAAEAKWLWTYHSQEGGFASASSTSPNCHASPCCSCLYSIRSSTTTCCPCPPITCRCFICP